ncbi:MAG: hypothetical protein HQL91_13920 [Magnetococcales bacterium]|nr:hypothetical protein [Magnetococcales bacterium]
MSDFSTSFRVRSLSLSDKVGVFAGAEDPRSFDTSSFPVGSLYFQTDGTAWKRIGAEVSAWVKLIAEEMMLVNLGVALGADGWTYPLNLAGPRNQELMVHDAQVSELLQRILAEQQKTNAHLSLITGEQTH